MHWDLLRTHAHTQQGVLRKFSQIYYFCFCAGFCDFTVGNLDVPPYLDERQASKGSPTFNSRKEIFQMQKY